MSARFHAPDPPRAGRYELRAEEARHLARVCRYAIGDRVEIFDGDGFVTEAEVVEIARDRVELVAVGPPILEEPPACPLTLATAMPKGERLDWLVEKATEVGVSRLVPLITERSVVDPRGSKLERLRRTIVEASKQSGRSRLMVLDEPVSWPEMATRAFGGVRLIADPGGLPHSRWPEVARGPGVALAIGPEGGFSPGEVQLALDSCWHPVRLARSILRIETAALVGAALVLGRREEG
ncbi:Ribosomal RNA small subunit methyltransferase E [Aquisphaera giovannonii]|uniref:Ribosomal RNA small subunit methyltransferase E n=1 Tax=Aquisphaera giovannonii TaxID=406548 RepID=A0A5B9WAU6_9BACT|nr:RsmE family RNA methyltransferase [Aquisphaera giovannonii]QEH37643.1 Ribosomal RNA small subunit methyltransferase E [Aquisphaera giovannonii]